MITYLAHKFWYQRVTYNEEDITNTPPTNEENEIPKEDENSTNDDSNVEEVISENEVPETSAVEDSYEYQTLPVEEKENRTRTFADGALNSILCTTTLESIQTDTTEDFLQQALQRLQNLERETTFLYEAMNAQQKALEDNGIEFGGPTQVCAICGDCFSFNSNESCSFHTGTVVQTKFKDLPDTVIDAYRPESIEEIAPEKFWVMSCCNNPVSSPGCCTDRHVPEEIEGLESTVYLDQSRLASSKAFFGTESMVVYN